MRILWLTNSPIPKVSELMGQKASPFAGWLVQTADTLLNDHHQLAICFPVFSKGLVKQGSKDNLTYYGYYEDSHKIYEYSSSTQKSFEDYITEFKPDLIHIWGSEYPRTLAMMKAVEAVGFNQDHVVISIQGLATMYCDHYLAGVPEKVIKRFTTRDLVRRDNLLLQYQKFVKQAEYESQALLKAKNVIGRTSWDFGSSRQLAPESTYHFCNETLRPSFYTNNWNYENCQKHSIFVSQSSYPIKGFHMVLKALKEVVKRYPDTIVYTTGEDVRNLPIQKLTSYQKYLAELMSELGLNDHVKFVGFLSEEKMCQQYLSANVFVSASSIENSPNSVGEAMLVGMPIVASFVGGTMDLLEDKKEGYLYQADASYMLAHYILEVFDKPEEAITMGLKAKEHALRTHDKDANMNRLLEIYQCLLEK